MAEGENEQPQDWSNEEENLHHLTPEYLEEVKQSAIPLMKAFFEIYKDYSAEEIAAITRQQGVSGALGALIDNIIPQNVLIQAPFHVVEFGTQCILFGRALDEILRRVGVEEVDELTPDELEKLWGVGDEENDATGTE